MNEELVFHRKKQLGIVVVAELLINDFRFFREVICYRRKVSLVKVSEFKISLL